VACLASADITTLLQMLHAASNGGCRLVIGRHLANGGMYVVLDLGRTEKQQSSSSNPAEPQEQSSANSTVKPNIGSKSLPSAAQQQQQQDPLADFEFASVQLRDGIDTVILGSEGLW